MSSTSFLLMEHHGLLIVFVAVLLEQLSLPVPAIPLLAVAGALAAVGKLYAPGIFTVAIIACLIGDTAWYWMGRRYGLRVLKTLCRISLEPDSCVSQTQSRFERWGVNSLVIAKFIPGLAVIAPPLAGALGVSWLRFLGLSTVSALLWVAAGLGAGMAFKTQIEHILKYLEKIGGMTAVGLVCLLAGYILYKWWQRQRFYRQLRMARITVNDLYNLMEARAEPIVLDVRSLSARKLDPHWIPTAIHIPIDQITHHVKDLARDRDIIVYCACPNEASAAYVAKQLMNSGFERVRPLQGGLDAWIAAGYVVDSTPKSTSVRSSHTG